MMSQASFWDADDITEPIHVRDTIIGPASTADVREFCRRYHYANGEGNAAHSWGLWHGPVLLGVIAFNNGTGPAVRAVFGPEHANRVWHIGRLAMAETAPHNSESRLIAGSLRAVAADYPDVWAVLTYAATGQGHVGYVYQATNALYLGMTAPDRYFIDQDGRRRSPQQGGNVSVPKARARGWTVHHEPGKHRYLYLLGNKRERRERLAILRYPVLPYPKGGNR